MIRTPTFNSTLPGNFAGLALTGLGAILAASAVPALADETKEPATELTKGEAELAELLEGRVAGEPQNCINDFRNRRLRTIDDTAYVYGRGRTIYVQRTRNPSEIDSDDVLVIRRFGGTSLCRLDFVKTIDRFSGFFTGGVQFEQFVPYTRVEKDDT